jgi:hypothetical protein
MIVFYTTLPWRCWIVAATSPAPQSFGKCGDRLKPANPFHTAPYYDETSLISSYIKPRQPRAARAAYGGFKH